MTRRSNRQRLITGGRELGLLGVVAAVALIIVFAMSLSWMWIIVGMLVKSPESVMTSSFLLLFSFTMASNIFVDPKTMPRLLQVLASVNPVSHLATASRGLMHGDVAMSDVMYVRARRDGGDHGDLRADRAARVSP